ncbi:MAG: methyltransferase domain-containing protein [Clostridiales bacterium]|nr:methyltransferase domain-containing protein [Clostridiales bacterium]
MNGQDGQWKCIDGIWMKKENGQVDSAFSEEQQESLYQLEDGSWWFQYRISIIKMLMKKTYHNKRPTFDVGGGNGYSASRLQKAGFSMVLLEPSPFGCKHGKKRGVANIVCGTLNRSDFEENSIEQLIMLDVLEHIEDEEMMLDTLSHTMKKEGKLILTVPAFPCLWSSEDDSAGHFRRYRKKRLETILQQHGFCIDYCTYFFSFLWLPVAVFRVGFERLGIIKRVEGRSKKEQEEIAHKQFDHPSKLIDGILGVFEKIEKKAILKKKTIPFGTSVLVCCHKE